MDVIAKKREGVGAMYLICTAIGLGFIIMGLAIQTIYTTFLGVALAAVSGFIFFKYISLPYAVISVDRENNLHLPKGVTVNIKDVRDVSYRRASARGIQYKWGWVTLTTTLGNYKYGYIADCEEVAKKLTDMMYQAKYENN